MASSGWQGNKEFPYASSLKCNLNITGLYHTGTSLRVVGQIAAVYPSSSTYYGAYYNYPVYVTPAGGSQMTLLTAYQWVYGGGNNGLDSSVRVNFDVTVSVTSSATSYNFGVYINMNNGQNTGTLTWTLSFASSGTAPSAGSIAGLSSYWDYGANCVCIKSTKISVNDGGLPLTELSFLCSNEAYTASGFPSGKRIGVVCVNNYGQILSNSTSVVADSGGYSLQGNTLTYTGLYTTNSAGTYRYITSAGAPTIVTVPPPPTITRRWEWGKSLEIDYTMPADGGYYSRTLQYTVNGGSTWTQVTTATGTAAKSGTYTITGLANNTWYNVTFRTVTTAGSTNSNTLHMCTKNPTNLYGSVSNAATHINKLYGRSGTRNWFNKNQAKLVSNSSTYTLLANDVIRVAASTSTSAGYKWWGIPIKNSSDVVPGTQMVLSFDMRTSSSQTSDIRLLWANSTDTGYVSGSTGCPDKFQTTNGEYVHVVKKFTVPYPKPSGAGNLGLFMYACISSAGDVYTDFKNVMLETGTVEHYFEPWSGTPTSDNWYYHTDVVSGGGVTATGCGGFYNLNGTVTTADARVWIGRAYLPAGTYTIKHEYVSGTLTGDTPSVWLYQNNRSWTRPFTDNVGITSSSTVKTKTFTLSSATDVSLAFYTRAGQVLTDFRGKVSIIGGSSAMTDFQPFSGTPTTRPICKLYGSIGGYEKLVFVRHTST